MVPLKWECKGVWGVRGVKKIMEAMEYCQGERYPTWDHTYQVKNLCAPLCIVWYGVGWPSGVGGGVALLELQ